MTQENFVDAIKIAVEEGSKRTIETFLNKPPGRSPSKHLLQLSEWYNQLEITDKNMVAVTITESIRAAIFGFFCVLDGVRAIEDVGEKGKLILFYEKDGERTRLNDDLGNLHEIYNAQ